MKKRVFFYLTCFLISINLQAQVRHAYYTFQHDPFSTITLNVHTTVEKTLFFELKKDGTWIETKEATGEKFDLPGTSRYLYAVEFDHLTENTTYEIEIFSQTFERVKTSQFTTLPSNKSDLKFVVGGDFEIPHDAEKILKAIAACDPSVILFGGDYPKDVYTLNDYKKWDDWLDISTSLLIKSNGSQIPWILAIGNNEVFGSFNQTLKEAPFFAHYFKQPAKECTYFSLPLSSELQLVVLDSGLTSSHDGPQKKWLEETLSTHTAKTVIALYHVPIYPSVRFKEENWYYKLLSSIYKLKDKAYLAKRLLSPQSLAGYIHWAPLFDTYRVFCAFEHHDHTFKRSHPIKGGKVNKLGTIYLGDGAIAPYPQFTPLQKFYDSKLEKTIGHVHFFWFITFKDDNMFFEALTPYGKSIDHFSKPLSKAD